MTRNAFRGLLKIDKSYWLLVVPILYATVPWFQYRMRGIIPFGFSMLWLLPKLSNIIAKLSVREGRAFIMALFWFFALMFMPEFFAIIGSQEHMAYYQVATIGMQMVSFVIAYYTVANRKFFELRFLTVVTLAGFILGGISSLRGLGIEGMESGRTMTGLQNAGYGISTEAIDNALTVIEIGLGGYAYAYNCAWMVGVILFAIVITKGTQQRILYAATLIGCFLSVKVCGLGTPVAIVALELLLFMLWFATRSRKLVGVLTGGVILLYFVYATMPTVFSPLSGVLDSIAENMSPGGIKERIVSVSQAFRGDASYANIRVQLQMKSWMTFLKHPIFGTFGPFVGGRQLDLGGHSYVLDMAGGYGLFGIFVFTMFIWSLLRYFRVLGQLYFGSRYLAMPVFFMGTFVISGLMNPVTFFANIVYLIPGIAWLSLSPQEEAALYWRTGLTRWHPGPYHPGPYRYG